MEILIERSFLNAGFARLAGFRTRRESAMPYRASMMLPCAALAALMLSACQQQAATGMPPASESSTPVIAPASTVPAAAPASASTVALPGDHAVTRHYRIAITLPALPADEAPLANALRATADNAKREFLQALPDPKQMPAFANRQFEMLLDFKVAADTPAFTSVRETGMQDTGGVHPIPVEASFVYDRNAAHKALAGFARAELGRKLMANAPKPGEGSPEAIREWKTNMLQMLDDGTRPTVVNFSVFTVRAGSDARAPSPGLTLIFPPYQVAPYVYGTQTVDVPASLFATFLKPEYRNAFAP